MPEDNYPEIPEPILHGWQQEGESLVPIWTDEEVLPRNLIDLMTEERQSESEEEEAIDSSCTTTDESESGE